MNMDDTRIFFAITKEIDPESGQHITTQQALRRMHCTGWRPGHMRQDTTVVTMLNGQTYILDHKFSEFHAWIMQPAFERDARLRAAGLKKSPGRPRGAKNIEKGETPEEESVGG